MVFISNTFLHCEKYFIISIIVYIYFPVTKVNRFILKQTTHSPSVIGFLCIGARITHNQTFFDCCALVKYIL